jgi:hypothetical protein
MDVARAQDIVRRPVSKTSPASSQSLQKNELREKKKKKTTNLILSLLYPLSTNPPCRDSLNM